MPSESIEIIKSFSDAGADPNRLIGLVVLCLFVMIGFILLRFNKSLENINLSITKAEANIKMANYDHKNQIVKCFYEVGLLRERRKNPRGQRAKTMPNNKDE
jgi:hypothetical protein